MSFVNDGEMGAAAFIDAIRVDAAAIARCLSRHGCDHPVEYCGGWAVGDVVRHLGAVHRWATEVVQTGQAAPYRDPEGSVLDDALPRWFVDGADALCAALDRSDPRAQCWTFGLPPEVAGFWRRRQALETAIHRFDVEFAVGASEDAPVDLAVAGVSEVVDFMYPRQIALGRTAAPAHRVELMATDTEGRWVIGNSGPVATIAGSAPAMLLMLWGRPHGALEQTGDPDALSAFGATRFVP